MQQPDMSKRRKGGMIEVVRDNMFAIAKEKIERAKAKAEDEG